VQADPNLPIAHEGLGMLAYYERDLDNAEKEFERAVQLNSTSFLAYFFSARAKLREGRMDSENGSAVVADLEKAISLNQQFAPAYATLATFYSMSTETREKALVAGRKAIELEPGNLAYAVSYGFVLLNLGKTGDAKTLASRIQSAARTLKDRVLAQQFSEAVSMRESLGDQTAPAVELKRRSHSEELRPKTRESSDTSTEEPPVKVEAQRASNSPESSESFDEMSSRIYDLKGRITAIDCANGVPGILTLNIDSVLMKFHYADFSEVEMNFAASSPGAASRSLPTCASLKGRRAKVTFHPAPKKEYDGELISIQTTS
jgi:tetratricopeptide (TPR) repeat protein